MSNSRTLVGLVKRIEKLLKTREQTGLP